MFIILMKDNIIVKLLNINIHVYAVCAILIFLVMNIIL